MTYSAIPAMREEPDVAAEWEPRLTMADYDRGALAGMAMTEKQGGFGRAREHHRRAAGRRPVRAHRPQVVLLLPPVRRVPYAAQAPAGLSCFVFESSDPASASSA